MNITPFLLMALSAHLAYCDRTDRTDRTLPLCALLDGTSVDESLAPYLELIGKRKHCTHICWHAHFLHSTPSARYPLTHALLLLPHFSPNTSIHSHSNVSNIKLFKLQALQTSPHPRLSLLPPPPLPLVLNFKHSKHQSLQTFTTSNTPQSPLPSTHNLSLPNFNHLQTSPSRLREPAEPWRRRKWWTHKLSPRFVSCDTSWPTLERGRCFTSETEFRCVFQIQ